MFSNTRRLWYEFTVFGGFLSRLMHNPVLSSYLNMVGFISKVQYGRIYKPWPMAIASTYRSTFIALLSIIAGFSGCHIYGIWYKNHPQPGPYKIQSYPMQTSISCVRHEKYSSGYYTSSSLHGPPFGDVKYYISPEFPVCAQYKIHWANNSTPLQANIGF